MTLFELMHQLSKITNPIQTIYLNPNDIPEQPLPTNLPPIVPDPKVGKGDVHVVTIQIQPKKEGL